MASREHKKVPTSKAADLCMTPPYALDPILRYLKPDWILWESACGQGHLSGALARLGFLVLDTDITMGLDFFTYQPAAGFDCQITNPPFSRKLAWIERSYQLGKPFALLLPVEILGVGAAQRLFEQFGVEIILLNRRVDFQTIRTSFAKSSSWFPVCWVTWGLNIGQPLTFGKILKRPDSQPFLFGSDIVLAA